MTEKDPTPIHPFPVQPEVELGVRLRRKVREAIELVLDEELEAALGAERYQRHGHRRGHRNGHKERQLVTEHGPVTLSVPRGRVRDEEGSHKEWRSVVLPRYQRRTKRVDEALLGAYLGGASSRRIRRALAPILGEAFLSKSAISRVVGRLKERFEAWRSRNLGEEVYAYV